jgi:membrane protein
VTRPRLTIPARFVRFAGDMTASALHQIVADAGSRWVADNAPRLGAALAYYAVFSLAPFLVLAIGAAGALFGHEAARERVSAEVGRLVGPEGGQAVQAVVASADQGGAAVGSVLGVVMLVVGAAALFGQLRDALNTVWDVRPRPRGGAWRFVRDRLLSLSMVLGTAFLLLVSLAVSSLLAALAAVLGDWHLGAVGLAVTGLVDLAVFTALFALLFRYLPDAPVAWRDVWLAAAVTAALFTVGKSLIGLYLGRAGVGTAFGAAGSLAVLLVWLYYAAQVFLFGAELTRAYAERAGSRAARPHAKSA